MRTKLTMAVLALLLVAGACDGDSDSGDSADTGETSSSTTSTTEAPVAAVALDASPVRSELSQAYQGQGGEQVEPTDAPAEPNTVTAHWYQADGEYVAVFAGFEATEPLCPGSSLGTMAGDSFDHVTNTPVLGDDACEGFSTPPPQGFTSKVCDGLIVLGTDIPADAEGRLFASLEVGLGAGNLAGVTGTVETGAAPPEIDLEADAYEVPEGFLPGGATEVTC